MPVHWSIAMIVAAVAGAAIVGAALRLRAQFEQVRRCIELLMAFEAERSPEPAFVAQLVRACGASGAELVLRRPDGSVERTFVGATGALRIEQDLGEGAMLALHFLRAPSGARKALVRRMMWIVSLSIGRRHALESARRHESAAQHYEKDARETSEENARLVQRHEAVLEVLPDGVAVTDDDGNIIRINAAGREIVGVDDLVGPASRQSLADASNPLLQALREGANVSGLEVAIAGPGAPRTINVKVSKLSSDPSSRAAVALFRDVTRELLLDHDLRRKSQELEQHVEALERATRLKSDFLASMSHELRTPLNAVIGFTEVLLDGTYGRLNDKQQECAVDVLSGGRHLLSLINDILDLSKIEAGRMELDVEDVDVAEVAAQAITFVRPQAAAKGIKIETEIGPRKVVARGDADRIRQVLVNLLSNAVKFTPRGGRVRVGASIEGASTETARIWVTDTGIGIAESDRGRLFREFAQLDGSVTRKFGGTGLGLAICKRLVQLHGGAIDFESKVGSGSTFWFSLPAITRAAGPTFQPSARLRRTSSANGLNRVVAGATALIIDSDAASVRLAEVALREAGIGATVASSLAAARRAANAPGLDMVIVDPAVDDATISEVNAFVAERFGPCVVVASMLRRHEATAGLRVAGFLEKPLDRTALIEQVRAARERKGGERAALVIDGNPDDASAISGFLEREGFSVEIASSMAAARSGLERDLSVVVLDVELPDGDGIDLLRQLLGRPCKTVVLTAKELDAKEGALVASLASIVLRKGMVSGSAFARHVTKLCESQRVARRRVLAVDDNEQNLRLVSAVLGKRGYEILQARDASSAVRIARAELPDVILMDLMLPDVDGLSATRELKGCAVTASIPIIAVTAQAMSGDAERAREAGCSDYVVKPFDSIRLVRAVERVMAATA